MIIYFAYKITNLSVFLFQYIKQIPEINGFKKSEFAAHCIRITLEGWQLHLEKAYPSWKTPTEKIYKIIFNRITWLY